ncbi:hypothetical protein NQ176_g5144 [Zarea fungicola]|uniref:Uncharacterized protein n=1 Tax=Zarea fungicola TaxID=93591 RepID=A0ACC1NBD8_9HYPO|nr:hypothetical protein NQ176_g5144 [Lecanicillium fungicola]
MKITATLLGLAALATYAVADDTAEPTRPPVAEGTCTAKLSTKLCDYDKSNLLAAAAGSRNGCWSLCDSEKYGPCSFVIFLPGNPYLGTGTCWLYPGDKFDSTKGTDQGCGSPFLEVYDKPSCTGGPAKPSVVCPAATGPSPVASPSPVAAICGYEAPENDCWDSCYASSGSTDCLNLCGKADDCEFAIFNALNEPKSPWMSGNSV